MDVRSDKLKSTNAEIDIILETVIEMIIKGYSRTNILMHFKESPNTIAKSDRSVDYYVAKAREQIKERFKPDSESLIALAATRYEDLYKKNYAIQDYRECRNVQDSFNKLAGLYEKDNSQHQNVIQINFED